MLSTKQIICEIENCAAKVNDCLNKKLLADAPFWLGQLNNYFSLLQQVVVQKLLEQSNETKKK